MLVITRKINEMIFFSTGEVVILKSIKPKITLELGEATHTLKPQGPPLTFGKVKVFVLRNMNNQIRIGIEAPLNINISRKDRP